MDCSSSRYFELLSFSFFDILKKKFIFKKYFANTFAFSSPICRIPREKIKRSNEISLLILIEFFKLLIDFSPHPSKFFKTFKSKLKISYGYLINFLPQKFSTTFFPKPSIFKASFDTKCFNFSLKISLQLNFISGHLVTASFFFCITIKFFNSFCSTRWALFWEIKFFSILIPF